MRINLPVTGRVVELQSDAVLSSTTDLKGRILAVNDDFVAYSGFSREELIGKAHNIVRHPDMPEPVFADMWMQLKAGRCWRGLVKNRCKNGDTYWVDANVSPTVEGSRVVGFVSVRRSVDPAVDLAEVERQYARVARGELSVHGGHLMSHSARRVAKLWDRAAWRPQLAGKILLAGLPVFLMLVLTIAWVVAAQWRVNHSAALAIDSLESWIEVLPLLGAIQRERGRTVAFVEARDPGSMDELVDARRQTDRLCAGIDCREMSSLRAARVAADDKSADVQVVVDGYTEIVEQMIAGMAGGLPRFEALEDHANAIEVLELIRIAESLGVERAAV